MKTIEEIKQFSKAEIQKLIDEIDNLPENERKDLMDQATDDCYDETWCSMNGIDYCNIKNRDFVYVIIYEYFKTL